MPTLSETLRSIPETSPVEPVVRPPVAPPAGTSSGYNPMMRSPLPPVWQASPDSLRQWTNNGVVPQTRIFTPTQSQSSSFNGTINQFVSATSTPAGGGSSGGSTTPSGNPSIQGAITTTTLNPNTSQAATLQAAKSFQLLTLSASRACRVQLYGTSLARSIDAGRPLDISPPAGSTQNIICDVVLDTSPFTWSFQSRVGANADAPQGKAVYARITNLSAQIAPVNVSVSFVPIEV